MLTTIEIWTRTKINIPWANEACLTIGDLDYLHQTYELTGKRTRNTIISPDYLTMTRTITFLDQAAMDEFRTDPKVQEAKIRIDSYNERYKIIETIHGI